VEYLFGIEIMISLIVHLETILNVSNFNTEFFLQIGPFTCLLRQGSSVFHLELYISVYLMVKM
jgi:hypothetical protein